MKHHAELVETVKEINQLNMGTTTDPTNNINRRSMVKEYIYDRGRIIRVNKRLKCFGRSVNSKYIAGTKKDKWSVSQSGKTSPTAGTLFSDMPAENLNSALQRLVSKSKANVDKFPMTIRADYHRSNLHNTHSQPSVRRKDDPRLLLSNDDFTQHTSVKPLLSEVST